MSTIFWLIFFFFILPAIVRYFKKHLTGPGDAQRVIHMEKNRFKNLFQKFKPTENDVYHQPQRGSQTTQSSTQSTTHTKNMDINQQQRMKKIFKWSLFILFLVIIAFNVIITIPAGNTGVRSLFGKVKDHELSSGLHLINPLEKIERMTIRTEEYTMSIAQGEGQRKGADQITALTNEGLPVDLDITVFYHLNESSASDVYRELGLNYQEKIIRPEIRSAIREVIAQYDAKAIYSEKRGEVATGIRDQLAKTIEPRGISVEQVLMRNVTLPQSLSTSIQAKLQAEQDAERLDFVLEKEKKEAERKRIEAGGQSDAQKILNETLTPRYLQYLYINELKDRAGTIYVPTGGDGIPLLKSI